MWLWTQHVEIPVATVDKVFKAILYVQHELKEWHRIHFPLVDGENWWREPYVSSDWKAALKTIKENIFQIIDPPGAHGSGHRGAVHKASRVAFGWKLGADDREHLRDRAMTYMSHCSDMGVELSVPDFTCRDPTELLPEYMRNAGVRKDDIVDLAADDEDDAVSCAVV